MIMPGDHFVISDREDVAAALVIISLDKTQPCSHSITCGFMFAKDGTSRTFSADLLYASEKGSVV
jgi:hypothetical protein